MCAQNTVVPVFSLFTIILAVMFTFAVVGQMLFRGRFTGALGTDRLHFENFSSSVLTLFVTITNDGWVNPMYEAIHKVGWASAIYFICYYIIVVWFLMSLFVSMFVHNFLLSEYDITDLASLQQSAAARAFLVSKEDRREMKSGIEHLMLLLPESIGKAARPASTDLGRVSETGHPRRWRTLLGTLTARVSQVRETAGLRWLSQWCRVLVTHPYFELFILAMIAVSTCTIASTIAIAHR